MIYGEMKLWFVAKRGAELKHAAEAFVTEHEARKFAKLNLLSQKDSFVIYSATLTGMVIQDEPRYVPVAEHVVTQ